MSVRRRDVVRVDWPYRDRTGSKVRPAVVALFLYSLLPIVADTVLGLRRVSHAAVEAARGMGMTDSQVLARIELPLALPVILTGIRVVLIQNIGMVTIAALIGGGGLGTFVFQGIGQTAIDGTLEEQDGFFDATSLLQPAGDAEMVAAMAEGEEFGGAVCFRDDGRQAGQ